MKKPYIYPFLGLSIFISYFSNALWFDELIYTGTLILGFIATVILLFLSIVIEKRIKYRFILFSIMAIYFIGLYFLPSKITKISLEYYLSNNESELFEIHQLLRRHYVKSKESILITDLEAISPEVIAQEDILILRKNLIKTKIDFIRHNMDGTFFDRGGVLDNMWLIAYLTNDNLGKNQDYFGHKIKDQWFYFVDYKIQRTTSD